MDAAEARLLSPMTPHRDLLAIRRWLERVRISIGLERRWIDLNGAERSRRWRRKRKGRVERPYTDWRTATVCAKAGHPLTRDNVRIEADGRRACRRCLNENARASRIRRRAA